jgi:7-cyano-7-deazaguanine synthase
MSKKKAVAVVSGGLDSTTLVYSLLAGDFEVDMISFNYGQRHSKELQYARAQAQLLDLRHDVIDLRQLGSLFAASGSSLVSSNEVPEGHYAEDNMKATVVPNRNMIMLSIAAGIGVARNADIIATGVHAGDHFIYPDCRPRFIAHANAAIVIGNEGFGPIALQPEGVELDHYIYAPFLDISKAQIAYMALGLDVPLHLTWSCYKGGENHCGKCGTCVERLEAIDDAVRRCNDTSVEDLTIYDDSEYWKVVIAERSNA